ncbi:very-long-chain 3-oxoacyl-CoA reductase 1-like [Miscanthus floridulus]|uniref:very-long-chain 3-oxoacyl-CoA reductase 1-like n=1 Tax=Miscanthus floridulus TaxID=154761 RepID=UPI00345AF3A2
MSRLVKSSRAWAGVSGPTSGMDRSMDFELARRGLNIVIVICDPNQPQVLSVADTITKTHAVQSKRVVFDLSFVSTAQGEEAMRRLREVVDGLDVGLLVNNAGVAKPCAVYLHEFDVDAWVKMIRVNLWALTEVTAAVLAGMVARRRGAIVNIGSGSTEAIPSFPLYTIYAATKRYVSQFSRSLYVEYRSKGIHIQCQAPLFVDTKMASSVAKAKRFSPFVPTSDAAPSTPTIGTTFQEKS